MSLNNLGLGFRFTATDMATGTFNRVSRGFGQMDVAATRTSRGVGRSIGVMVAGFATLAGGIGTLAGALGMANAAADFNQSMQRVGNISGATSQQLQQLRRAAIDAGIATSFSPDEAAQGLAALASRGFTSGESIEYLDQALSLAEGGLIGVEDAAGAVSSAIRVFGLSGEEAATTADRLLKITNLTSLQANDLTLALGTVSRGAGQTAQNMNEMLVAMGLVKNAGLDTSVAASSVSSALQFMAKNSEDFSDRLGVSVTNADGTFRDFIDVVMDADKALGERFTSQAERATVGLELFGRFGVTAFQNVATQIKNGVRNAEGDLLRGADAVAYLRDQLASAEGTAEDFRDALLDTFAGQKRLLEGTIQTLGVVMGDSFAQVFKPIVKLITDSLNAVLRFIDELPSGLKKGIAVFVLLGGVVMTVLGAMFLLSAAFAFLMPMIPAIVGTMIAMTIIMLPLIAIFGALASAVGIFYYAAKNNLGGFGDEVEGIWAKVKLAFQGIIQLFSNGGFSGEVLAEMEKAENQGVMSFVLGLWRAGERIKSFFEGMISGFRQAWIVLEPAWDRLKLAFRNLFDSMQRFKRMIDPTGASLDDAKGAGVSMATMIAEGIAWTIDMFGGFLGVIADVYDMIAAVRIQFLLFRGSAESAIINVVAQWYLLKEAILSVTDQVTVAIGRMVAAMPATMRMSLGIGDNAIHEGQQAAARIATRPQRYAAILQNAEAQQRSAMAPYVLAEAAAGERAAGRDRINATQATAADQFVRQRQQAATQREAKRMHATFEVDGRVLAEVLADAEGAEDAATFKMGVRSS